MDNNLYTKLTKFDWLIKRRQNIGASKFDPNRGQGRILATLSLKDGISTKDLSYILGITVTALNETLGKLEKSGLVQKVQSEEDKRVMLIYLTDEGRSEISGNMDEDENDFLSCLSEEEQVNFESYIDRIIEHLESTLGEASEDFAEHMKRIEVERERIKAEGFPHGPHHGPHHEPHHGPHHGPGHKPPHPHHPPHHRVPHEEVTEDWYTA